MNLVYMKTKIYLGILSFVLGLSLASCSEDDDYTIHTTPILLAHHAALSIASRAK